MNILASFDKILPLASLWAEQQESLIVKSGVAISREASIVARKVGVRCPEQVRILIVPFITRPEDSSLKQACIEANFLTIDTCGLTLRYGIFIKKDCALDYPLLVHELVHVAQYERFGSIKEFLKNYLFQILTIGYPEAPLEQEAIKKAKEICN